jgi:hypothetical protein
MSKLVEYSKKKKTYHRRYVSPGLPHSTTTVWRHWCVLSSRLWICGVVGGFGTTVSDVATLLMVVIVMVVA